MRSLRGSPFRRHIPPLRSNEVERVLRGLRLGRIIFEAMFAKVRDGFAPADFLADDEAEWLTGMTAAVRDAIREAGADPSDPMVCAEISCRMDQAKLKLLYA